jgi:ankyrin repeat protein
VAIDDGPPDTVRLLVENGADLCVVDRFGDTPLHLAISKGQLDTVRLLIENGVDLEQTKDIGNTPLHEAIDNCRLDITRLLLENGANVNAVNDWGDTPLHRALDNDRRDIVRLLLENGANVNVVNNLGETPLMWGMYCNCRVFCRCRVTTTAALLAAGAMPNLELDTVPDLHRRVITANPTTPFALEPGESTAATLGERDEYGRTALHYAALKTNYGAWATLKTAMGVAGLDINVRDEGGMTPLNYMVSVVFAKVKPNPSHSTQAPARWKARRALLDILTQIGQVNQADKPPRV